MIRNFSVKLYRANPADIPDYRWKVSASSGNLFQFFLRQLCKLPVQGFNLFFEGVEFFFAFHGC